MTVKLLRKLRGGEKIAFFAVIIDLDVSEKDHISLEILHGYLLNQTVMFSVHSVLLRCSRAPSVADR